MKKEKIDYKMMALFEMAKKHNEEMNKYVAELKEHIGDENVDDYIWDFVLEPKGDVQGLIKKVSEEKQKKVTNDRSKEKKR